MSGNCPRRELANGHPGFKLPTLKPPIHKIKKPQSKDCGTKGMVGPSGFEPETFCTPSKRATRLRYGPLWWEILDSNQ